MKVIQCRGTQLEKSSRTSPEDAFVRSQVTYREGQREKTFHLLYLEYFDQKIAEFTPFKEDPVIRIGEQEFSFRDVAALAAWLHHSEYQQRKRVYIHDFTELQKVMENTDWEIVKQVLIKLADGKEYEVKTEPHYTNK
ncbi:MAG: hypothetical protein H0Z32_00460 [Bacillaceae bacterium]|nr:hypothetical protein [Bacillaceae bacterium]